MRSLLHVLLILSLLCSCSQKEQIAVFPDGQKLYDSSLEKQTDLLADPVLNGFVAYIRSEFGDFQKLLAEYADSLFDSDMDTALLIRSMAYSYVEIGFSLFYSIDRRSRNESIFSWSFNDLEPDEPPRIKNASLNPEKLYYKAWDDDELYEVIILPDNTVIVQYCYASGEHDEAFVRSFRCVFNKKLGTYTAFHGILKDRVITDFTFESVAELTDINRKGFESYADIILEVQIKKGEVSHFKNYND